ncbi:MAG: MotA/TolQ/ExbB proton channel family protein [Paramuribaculum sp.]|nr:MotA/TolQ/ExbB proton channel family protein [Paramuribaculum sp.]
MKTLSDILFIISNGLLIPVVLLLLCLLVRALCIALRFYSVYRTQKRISAAFRKVIAGYSEEALCDSLAALADIGGGDPVVSCLTDIVTHRSDSAYCEHALADFQVEVSRQLAPARMLIRFGPMLGLMGTLIPMGPALVGLATGDISSMAYNMQVAFATTVVGMLVAAIGLATLQVSRRFYARSLNDLEFFYSKLNGK